LKKANRPDPTPFPELNAVLEELVQSAQVVLCNDFIAAYLHGSFAVGDFDHDSDVDLIIVVENELTSNEVDSLQTMHERIYNLKCAWAQHLEGSYFPKEVLRYVSKRGKSLWYLDNGSRSLIQSEHDNTAVVRSVVRERGIPLAGPNPASLVNPISVNTLRREILENMNHWGQQILADPEQINNRFYQTFAVLHYCRTLHDYLMGIYGSKRTGAEWVKTNLDPSWADLIDRAWDGRPNPALSVRTPADPTDLKRTLEFVKYIIEQSKIFDPRTRNF
jgi:predicted nucleotidyltransferase